MHHPRPQATAARRPVSQPESQGEHPTLFHAALLLGPVSADTGPVISLWLLTQIKWQTLGCGHMQSVSKGTLHHQLVQWLHNLSIVLSISIECSTRLLTGCASCSLVKSS